MAKDTAYFGSSRQLEILRENLTSPRGTAKFNIMGMRGSGKSALLSYVQNMIQEPDVEWKMRGSDPRTVIIEGRGFDRTSNFFRFLADNLIHSFNDVLMDLSEKVDESTLHGTVICCLERLTVNDAPLVIMVDDFDVILESMQASEAQGLNILLQPRVYYLLVTDHRSIREINKKAYAASDFFPDTIELHIEPLHRAEAIEFTRHTTLSQGNDEPTIKGFDYINMIVELGGGHPALLIETLRALRHEFKYLYSQQENVTVANNQEWKTGFLRFLPANETIQYYLLHIKNVVQKLSPTLQEFLISLASGDMTNESERKKWHRLLQNRRFLQQLRLWGISGVDSVLVPCIPSALIRYTLLENLIPVTFSDAEKLVFNELKNAQPDTVSFEQLERVLQSEFTQSAESKEIANGDSRDAQRRFTDGTIIRVRRKLAAARNAEFFDIGNERGIGYFMTSKIPFDTFYHESYRASDKCVTKD